MPACLSVIVFCLYLNSADGWNLISVTIINLIKNLSSKVRMLCFNYRNVLKRLTLKVVCSWFPLVNPCFTYTFFLKFNISSLTHTVCKIVTFWDNISSQKIPLKSPPTKIQELPRASPQALHSLPSLNTLHVKKSLLRH